MQALSRCGSKRRHSDPAHCADRRGSGAGLFPEIETRNGMHSLSYVFDLPVEFEQAPELFCLDLYKEFDVDSLEALAAPAQVH